MEYVNLGAAVVRYENLGLAVWNLASCRNPISLNRINASSPEFINSIEFVKSMLSRHETG